MTRAFVLERVSRYGSTLVEGAAVTVALGDRSPEWLASVMRCRATRAAALRDEADPLAVPGASVRVLRDDGAAAIVQIRSRNLDAAAEVVRRVQLMHEVRDLGAEYGDESGRGGSPRVHAPGSRGVRAPSSARPPRSTFGF